MEPEDIRVRLKRLQTKSRVNPRFGPAGDEELDERDVVHIAGEKGQERRCRLLISALIEGVNDDEGQNFHCLERPDNKFLHLRTKGLASNIRACLQDRKQLHSKLRVQMSELEGQGREDGSKVAPVFEIPRTEETGPQHRVHRRVF